MGSNVFVRNFILLMTGGLASKALGFVREIIFAHRFGAGAVSDAFLLTSGIPDILFTSFATAINTSFVPLYMKMENEEKRTHFVSNLLSICFIITFVGWLLVNFFPHQVLWFFAASLAQETKEYAIIMLHIVSFAIFPVVLKQVFQAYVQANEKFVSIAFIGLITNSVMIIAFLLATEKTYYLLSVGGVCSQMCLMIILFYSAKTAGLQYTKVLDFHDPVLREMVILTIPRMVEDLACNMSILVDRNIAAYLGVGVISAMSYGKLLVNMGGTIVTGAVVTTTFPVLSRLATKENKEEFASFFKRYFQLLCYVLCPISVFLVACSDNIVDCVLAHGAMQASAAKMIWECAVCYAVGILPSGLQNFLVQGCYAFRDTKTPTGTGVFFLLCNIGLSLWTSRFWGHIGVAASTSVSFFIGFFSLAYFFWRKHGISVFQLFFNDALACLALSVFSAAGSCFLLRMIWMPDSLFVKLGIEFFSFTLLYGISLFITHRHLLRQMLSYLKYRP